MARHGDSPGHLVRAIVRPEEKFDRKTFYCWAEGVKLPGTVRSFEMLARVEHRYRLPAGYFRSKLTNSGRALVGVGRRLTDVSVSERRRLAWHLPDDFDQRPKAERDEILQWIRTVIVSGSTEYRRFQAEALKVRYALRFPDLSLGGTHVDGPLAAPRPLVKEMGNLIRFKTATLTQIGFKRSGVWGEETVSQKIEHFGLLFGALSGDPQSPVAGYGVPDPRRHPQAAAEAVRGFLMLRLALHLGVRQKNLRQLMICPRDRTARSERQLEQLKRGELRWNPKDGAWEVLIPSVAFKNAHSSFFANQPFRLLLPDLDGLAVAPMP